MKGATRPPWCPSANEPCEDGCDARDRACVDDGLFDNEGDDRG